ncbi:MAG TPA: chemotaxis protein CheW [Candidatus Sulfotelmatobacter sp.]|nr:chemotaxis protein CheW [Candidatus Sulfotelmatobacter sp.]
MTNSRQYCTFFLDHYLFGIELSKVQEVIQQRELTKVPLAPFVVRGLMNLRGQIVIAVDLRRQLELPDRPPDRLPMSVVVRAGEDAVSLLVDEIGDVVEAGEETFEPPPETLRGALRSAILGVHKLDKQLMHVLDTERACAMVDHAELATSDR